MVFIIIALPILGSIAVSHARTGLAVHRLGTLTSLVTFTLAFSLMYSSWYTNCQFTENFPWFGISVLLVCCLTLLICIFMVFNNMYSNNFVVWLLTIESLLIVIVLFLNLIDFLIIRHHGSYAGLWSRIHLFFIFIGSESVFPFVSLAGGLLGMLMWLISLYYVRLSALNDFWVTNYGSVIVHCLFFLSINLNITCILSAHFGSDIVYSNKYLYLCYFAFSCWYLYFFVPTLVWSRGVIVVAFSGLVPSIVVSTLALLCIYFFGIKVSFDEILPYLLYFAWFVTSNCCVDLLTFVSGEARNKDLDAAWVLILSLSLILYLSV